MRPHKNLSAVDYWGIQANRKRVGKSKEKGEVRRNVVTYVGKRKTECAAFRPSEIARARGTVRVSPRKRGTERADIQIGVFREAKNENK